MVILDENEISFPDLHLYHPKDGLIAIGGDLSVERIWFAYQLGIFPWFNPEEEILGGLQILDLFFFLMS
jgi:leucyl/phenylalanyl-tRNA--protein transferase